MSDDITLLYGTDEELQSVFSEWRKPKSNPARVQKEMTNPFTGETVTVNTHDYDTPFDEDDDGEGIPDWDAVKSLSIAGGYQIPAGIVEEYCWEGPPILCAPPASEGATLNEVPQDCVDELLDGGLEKRMQESYGENYENIADLLNDIKGEVADARKDGGRLAIYLSGY